MPRRFALFLVLVLASGMLTTGRTLAVGATPPPNATSTALPDTPVGRQLAWALATVNDPAALTPAAMTAHFAPSFLTILPPEQAVAATKQFAAAYGPIAFVRFVRPFTVTHEVGLVTARTGKPFVIIIAVEEAEPRRIVNLTFQPAPPALTDLATTAASTGGLVDIGGRRLYLSCMGEGDATKPTVVFEAGHGNDSTTWLAVQAALATDIRVCAYDRANPPGSASDPAPTPRTAHEVVADLHALLTAANVPGPYVLVGHSLGGLLVRLYASEHPDDVAGLVLVDPTHEDQDRRLRELIGPELWAATEQSMAGFVDAEGFDFEAIANEIRAARTEAPLKSLPLVVLTHGRPTDAAQMPPGWPIAEEERLWRELHADLAGLVPDGRQIIAEQSGHFIQIDQPDLVVDAVREVAAATPAA